MATSGSLFCSLMTADLRKDPAVDSLVGPDGSGNGGSGVGGGFAAPSETGVRGQT